MNEKLSSSEIRTAQSFEVIVSDESGNVTSGTGTGTGSGNVKVNDTGSVGSGRVSLVGEIVYRFNATFLYDGKRKRKPGDW